MRSDWLRSIPGFRSGVRWKQAVAAAVFVSAVLFAVAGLWGVTVVVLLLGLIATDPAPLLARTGLSHTASQLAVRASCFAMGAVATAVLLSSSNGVSPEDGEPPPAALNQSSAALVLQALPTQTVPVPTATPSPSPTKVPPSATPAPPTQVPTATRVPPTRTPSPTTAATAATPTVASAEPSSPCQAGQVKGNRNSMIYHEPGQRDYGRTRANVACFDTGAEAQTAGYRRALR